jgi:hypothetical protein
MFTLPKKIFIHDTMQKGEYLLTEPIGENFDSEFCPELTPKEMLALGVFGGKYMTDCKEEFPASWFAQAKLCSDFPNPKLNFFKVNASQSLFLWKKKGWISSFDPRGWFQWYCRYYFGRRINCEDKRQIKRWKAMKRHIVQLKKNCTSRDWTCRRKQRQVLLHWAYDSRKL